MKPYYEHAGITIYHGDCREILPHIRGNLVCIRAVRHTTWISGRFQNAGMHAETTWVSKISTGAYTDAMPEEQYQQWQIDVM